MPQFYFFLHSAMQIIQEIFTHILLSTLPTGKGKCLIRYEHRQFNVDHRARTWCVQIIRDNYFSDYYLRGTHRGLEWVHRRVLICGLHVRFAGAEKC